MGHSFYLKGTPSPFFSKHSIGEEYRQEREGTRSCPAGKYCLVMSSSLFYALCLKQCRMHHSCSVNICWMTKGPSDEMEASGTVTFFIPLLCMGFLDSLLLLRSLLAPACHPSGPRCPLLSVSLPFLCFTAPDVSTDHRIKFKFLSPASKTAWSDSNLHFQVYLLQPSTCMSNVPENHTWNVLCPSLSTSLMTWDALPGMLMFLAFPAILIFF